MENEKNYTKKEIIDINKDGTPNYAVWIYTANAKTNVITSISRIK
jgi:hypothetical protein